MNKEIILDALESAEYLIESEIQAVEIDELKEEYKEVLKKIREGVAELLKTQHS